MKAPINFRLKDNAQVHDASGILCVNSPYVSCKHDDRCRRCGRRRWL